MTSFIRRTTALAILATLASAPALAQDTPTKTPTAGTASGITLDQIADAPAQYAGKNVTVTGRVSSILGPRMFTIDNGRWIDFRGDTVIITPAPLAALVTEGSTITVTGVVKPLLDTKVEREWGWFSDDPTVTAEFKEQSGIVAQSVTMMRDRGQVALTIDMANPPMTGEVVSDLAQLARTDDAMLVGKRVAVKTARVESVGKDGGFWVSSGEDRLFVLPDSPMAAKVTPGENVELEGFVLVLPDRMKAQLGNTAANEQVYVYAKRVAAST